MTKDGHGNDKKGVRMTERRAQNDKRSGADDKKYADVILTKMIF